MDEETRAAAAVGLALAKAKHDLNNLSHVARGWSRLLKDPRTGLHQAQEGIDAVLSAAEQTSELLSGVLSLGRRASSSEAVCSLTQELTVLSRGLRYLLPAPERLQVELGTHALVSCNFAKVQASLLEALFAVRDMLGDDALALCLADAPSAAGEPEVELVLSRISSKNPGTAPAAQLLRLRFPAERGSAAQLATGLTSPNLNPDQSSAPVVRPRSTTVLLVDDHRDVRRLATTMLERAGYQVLTASDAEEALITSQNYDGTIHVLCCDAQMPGLPALSLVSELVAARPDLKVLICTGERPQGELAEFPRLSKPFSYQQLVSAVRSCLD
ncbi:MAG TPA: response regulator [Polyangiaceae bacterium]|jgi:CheY-like chemotaxis protein|nr:response regulator [Polyangiaceae bacterium]